MRRHVSATLIGQLLWITVLTALLATGFSVQVVNSAEPAGTDVLTLRSGKPPQEAAWCATAVDVGVDQLSEQTCRFQPLSAAPASRGIDSRAFWVRLTLTNSGDQTVSRWVEIGHPRTAERTLYVGNGPDRIETRSGLRVPLAEQSFVASMTGLLPVDVAPGQELVALVRVVSHTHTGIDLRLWDPIDYTQRALTKGFWESMGMGGLLISTLLALLMLWLTRETAYGLFGLAMIGSLLNISVTAGWLQRLFWPVDLPVPLSLLAVGPLLALIGYYGMLRMLLPEHISGSLIGRLVTGLAAITAAGLLASVLIDLRLGMLVWGYTAPMCALGMLVLSFRAWRAGNSTAGALMVVVLVPALLSTVRLLYAAVLIDYPPAITQIAPWMLALTAPILLLGLLARTQQIKAEMIRLRTEQTAQLTFIAQMSHELRSPLDTILGHAQLLGRTHPQSRGLLTIHETGRQLLRTIDDVLEYARGASGMLKLRPEPVDLTSFLRGIERMGRLLIRHPNLRFDLSIRPDPLPSRHNAVIMDTDRVRQVLLNLLSNAHRHTHQGQVQLSVQLMEAGLTHTQISFTVKDSGEGIDPEDMERIFRPFERARKTRQQLGSGLGLAIAKQLVELMGSRLEISSTLGVGTELRFLLSLRRCPSALAEAIEGLQAFDAAGYLGPQRHILLVDDDAASRQVLAQLLSDLGFLVTQSNGGVEVITRWQELPPLDLVITDQFMPDGDGWMVLDVVSERAPEVPVILISAAPALDQGSGQRQFTAYFLKPLNHAALLRIVGDLLELRWSAEHHPLLSTTPPLPTDPPPPADTPITVPDQASRSLLAELVDNGEISAIADWARELQRRDPAMSNYADLVLAALAKLDLQALRALSATPQPPTVR
jgi:two-component system, sensor histidine kinase LadS